MRCTSVKVTVGEPIPIVGEDREFLGAITEAGIYLLPSSKSKAIFERRTGIVLCFNEIIDLLQPQPGGSMFLWVKAFHLISVVTVLVALFYLAPRIPRDDRRDGYGRK